MSVTVLLEYSLTQACDLARALGEREVLEYLEGLREGAALLSPWKQVEVLREVTHLIEHLWKRQDELEGFPNFLRALQA